MPVPHHKGLHIVRLVEMNNTESSTLMMIYNSHDKCCLYIYISQSVPCCFVLD